MNNRTIYPASAVANHIIQRAQTKDQSLTPMQVIKLVYLAHGWSLGLRRVPLVREDVQAWKFGPVIPSLYHALKQYGSSAVTSPINCERVELDAESREFVDSVMDAYKDFSGLQLSQITHQDGTPWKQTYDWLRRGAIISNDLIEQHFLNLGAERQSSNS